MRIVPEKNVLSSMYSRALHSTNFGDKKNQCISKTLYCELLLHRDNKTTVYLRVSTYTLQYKFLHCQFFDKKISNAKVGAFG